MSDEELEALLAEARGERGGAGSPGARREPGEPGAPAPADSTSDPGPLAGSTSASGAAGAPLPESGISRLLGLRVASHLCARELELLRATPLATCLLLLMAPLAAASLHAIFAGSEEGVELHFALALYALCFGCFNSASEVVSERALMLRERRFGVPVRAYLLSKVLVGALLAAPQCLVLVSLADRSVQLDAPLLGLYIALFCCALSGTCLGLLVSSVARRARALLVLLPGVLLAQGLAWPRLGGADRALERVPLDLARRALPLRWALEALEALRGFEVAWLPLLQSLAGLGACGLSCVALAAVALWFADEV